MQNVDYKQRWEKLEQLVDEKLSAAMRKDEAEAYNGGFAGNSLRYEEFKRMMDECTKDEKVEEYDLEEGEKEYEW